MKTLKFRIDSIVDLARKVGSFSADGVTVKLPFISFSFKPNDTEQSVAKVSIIYLKDKMFFNPRKEEGDHNIQSEIGSLRNIRKFLNKRQMDLSDHTKGGLFLIIELMLSPIRQFLTFHEHNSSLKEYSTIYHEGYALLRDHLCSCISRIHQIAGIEIPEVYTYFNYDSQWNLDAYEEPESELTPFV